MAFEVQLRNPGTAFDIDLASSQLLESAVYVDQILQPPFAQPWLWPWTSTDVNFAISAAASEEPKQPNTLDEQPLPGPWSVANYQATFEPDLPPSAAQYAQFVGDDLYRVGPWSAALHESIFAPLYLLASMQGEGAIWPEAIILPEDRRQPTDYGAPPFIPTAAPPTGLPDVNAVLPPDFLFVQTRDINVGTIAQPERLPPPPAGGVPADDGVYFHIENPEPAPLVYIVGETGVNLPRPTVEIPQTRGGKGPARDQVDIFQYPSIFTPPFFAAAVVLAPKEFFVGDLPIFLPPPVYMQSVFEERDTVEIHEPINVLPDHKQLFQAESEFRPPDIFAPPPEPPIVVPPAPVDCADPPDPGIPHPKPAPTSGTSIDDAKPAPDAGHPIGCE